MIRMVNLDGLDALHVDRGGWCAHDGEGWPCTTSSLVSEVRSSRMRISFLSDAHHAAQSQRDAARFVCTERERELLEIKGPCSSKKCRLHYAHAGPCDVERPPGPPDPPPPPPGRMGP